MQIPSCVILCSACLLAAARAEPGTPSVPIPPAAFAIPCTATPINIDGLLDEPCWQAAVPVRADYVFGHTNELDSVRHMAVRVLCDDRYLYLGYETFDTNLVAVGSGRIEASREGLEIAQPGVPVDVAEFFVSLGDRHFFWELHHNASNQFNDIWITTLDPAWPIAQSALYPYGIIFSPESTLTADRDATPAMAVHLKPKANGAPSTVNDGRDMDTGYTAELRLPWYSLGVPAARRLSPRVLAGKPDPTAAARWNVAGLEVRLLSVVQDGDRQQRYHHSSATFPGGWFHLGWDHWPLYRVTAPATVGL